MREIKFLFLILGLNLIFYFPVFQGKTPLPVDNLLADYPWKSNAPGFRAKSPAYFDVMMVTYPWKKIGISEMKSSRFPLWNQFFGLGYPYFAAMQGGFLYPTTLLFLILPFNLAWSIHIFLQTFLAGVFMFLLLRKFKLSSLSSFFGAIVFSFCGHFMVWLEYGTLVNAACWLPLSILLVELFFEKPKVIYSFILGLVWTISFFAGFPQTSFYLIVFTVVYYLYKLVKIKPGDFYKRLTLLPFGLLVFLGTSLIQLLPFLEYLSLSTRNLINSQKYFSWSILPANFISFIFPDFFGHPGSSVYWGKGNFQEYTFYLGIVPLFLILWSFFRIRKKIRFWILILVGVLILSVYNPLLSLLYKLNLPVISKMSPSRLIVLISFTLAIISAYGIEEILKRKTIKLKEILIFLSGTIILLLLSLYFFRLPFVQQKFNYRFSTVLPAIKTSLVFPLAVLFLFILANIFRVTLKINTKIFVLVIIFLTFLDLFCFGRSYNPFVDLKRLPPPSKIIEYLQKDQEVFRYLSFGEDLPGNLSSLWGINGLGVYDTLIPIGFQKFADQVKKDPFRPGNPPIWQDYSVLDQDLLNLANVKYFITSQKNEPPDHRLVFEGEGLRVYLRKNYWPRFYFLNEKKNPDSLIKVEEYFSDKISLITDVGNDFQLVISNLNYPGWEAKVNGVQAKILPYKEYFLSTLVPKGENIVKIEYKPTSFRLGEIVSLTTFLILFGYLLRSFLKLLGKQHT